MSVKRLIPAAAALFLTSLSCPGAAIAQDKQDAPSQEGPGWDAEAQKAWAQQCEQWDEWSKAGPPFRIYGNSYYVGTCGISSILITGDQGHVLIDGGTTAGPDIIAANIEKLGFKLSDVKLLLISHEHYDHAGGIAELQRRSGAKLLVTPEAKPVMESGIPAENDPQKADLLPFPAARVDGTLENGKPVRVGSLLLIPHVTPGHTPGAVSWQWRSCAGRTCAAMVYADSLSPVSSGSYRFSDHPAYVAAYRKGLAHLAQLDCTILLTPHPSASHMWKRFSFGSPFGEPSCRAYARDLSERLDGKLGHENPR
ncbi:subclass B3 metallo-beta-lactamase [Altericroceibacterium spongiae]|uniref:Subclass B3 metallo-beta-lactamase n=1 Tax=Altericroceibacterium spongiae TaxID=2320269 RepID=A0A420EF15_9SPHN|nr:subclass B3 metallo-beta-lactamase [Altericroceibacterium spongiae]RKF19287.1 subclass B3 metallo-beta-lactamase [Altericroceibacterium spongiae]